MNSYSKDRPQINCKREDIKYPGQSQILSSSPHKKSIKYKAPKITTKTVAKAESVVCTCSFSQSAGTIPAQTWENRREREREKKVRAKLSFEITDSVGCRQNRAVHCNRRWLESERVRARGGERASAGGRDCYQMLSHTHLHFRNEPLDGRLEDSEIRYYLFRCPGQTIIYSNRILSSLAAVF